MPATPLAATSRYVPVSWRHINWLPAVAATTIIPTRAEINAGTDLTGQIPPDGVDGWTTEAEYVEAPDFIGGLTPKIPKNAQTVADSSLTLYMSSTSADVRTLLTVGLAGFINIMWEGDVAGRKMSTFSVAVSSASPTPSGTDPATLKVGFGIFAYSNMATVPA